MTKIVNIRNVPNNVHRILKERAKQARMSLSAYVLKELEKIAERPTVEELQERLRTREPVISPISSVELIRKMRDALETEEPAKMSAKRVSTQRSQKNRGHR